MKTYDNIPEELNSLACTHLVAISNKHLPFSVPSNYFETVASQMASGVKAAYGVENNVFFPVSDVFTVPNNYFESFAIDMLQIVKSVDQNIHNRTIPNTNSPYSVPDNYFETASESVLSLINGTMNINEEWDFLTGGLPKEIAQPFQVSTNYFENLSEDILEQVYEIAYPEPVLENSILHNLKNNNPFAVPETYFDTSTVNENNNEVIVEEASKSIPFQPKKKNKFAITTVAASVILLLSFGAFKFLLPNNDNVLPHSPEEIAALSKTISNESIEDYISIYNEDFAYTDFFYGKDKSINDYAEIINTIPNDEINEYLEIIN